VKAALTRYRVMAWATGVLLLLLTLHVVVQAFQKQPGQPLFEAEGLSAVVPGAGTLIPIAHGWLYLIYVIVSLDLWFRTRLNTLRMVGVVLAGTIPFMSFVAERWVRHQLEPRLEAQTAPAAN
jgi:integral membrane protein